MTDKSTVNYRRVKVQGITEAFNTFSGGDMSREVTQAWNGGSPGYENLTNPATYSNITVGKDYRHSDADWVKEFQNGVNIIRRNITVQDLDESEVAVGKPKTYKNCLLVGLTAPTAERGGTAKSEVTLEFATNGPFN